MIEAKKINKIQNMASCPVCNSLTTDAKIEAFDDRYGHPGLFHIVNCSVCGHRMTSPRLLESELGLLYGTYYPRKNIGYADVAREAQKVSGFFSRFIRWWAGADNQGQYSARPGELMLDVGCGSGTSLLEAKALGAKSFGIEADPNVKAIATALGLTVHIGSLQDNPFPDQSFDLIVMNQVIEHIPEPHKALQLLRERLTANGRMVLVFPNTSSIWCRLSGRRWINWHVPYHLHHFTGETFSLMVQSCGLKVVRSRTITPNVWTLLQIRAMRQRSELGVPNPIWAVADRSDSAIVSGSSLSSLRTFARLGVLSVLAFMNRILDCFGLGDSLMVELRRSDI
jgi:SAM-dependent methyltransferase